MRKLPAVFAALAALVVPMLLGASAARASNDPLYRSQYGLPQIQAPAAWTKTKGNGVIVAVVDSGVDLTHPDLKANLVPGHDFGDNDDNPQDDSGLKDGEGKLVKGHGTHVAGIVAAVTDNNVGVAGTAPLAKIMPLKVFASNPNSSLLLALSAVPNAIRYAVDHGARVINLSLGGLQGLDFVGSIETPCADAYSRGALCVVAAGNSGDKPSGYSRNVQFVVVTANDEKGDHAAFGQYADTQWALSAPGVGIISTWPVDTGKSYQVEQGTSMSTPHVAGVAALLFAQHLSVGQVVDRLLSTATPMGNPGVNGAGRVNAGAAAGAAPAPAPVTTLPSRIRTGTPGTAAQNFPNSNGDEFFATGTTTKDTLPPTAAADDNAAFAAGPQSLGRLTTTGSKKKAAVVSDATMAITLGALAVFGVGWGALSRIRRRPADA